MIVTFLLMLRYCTIEWRNGNRGHLFKKAGLLVSGEVEQHTKTLCNKQTSVSRNIWSVNFGLLRNGLRRIPTGLRCGQWTDINMRQTRLQVVRFVAVKKSIKNAAATGGFAFTTFL